MTIKQIADGALDQAMLKRDQKIALVLLNLGCVFAVLIAVGVVSVLIYMAIHSLSLK